MNSISVALMDLALLGAVFVANLVLLGVVFFQHTTISKIPLCGILLCCAEIPLTDIFLAFQDNSTIALFWLRLRYVGLSFFAPFLLIFILQYLGRLRETRRWFIVILFVVPVLTQIAIWSNPETRLFFASWKLSNIGFISVLETRYTGWFIVYALFNTGLYTVCILVLLWHMWQLQFRNSRPYLIFILMFISVFIIPIVGVGNLLQGAVNITPLTYGIFGCGFSLFFFKYKVLDLIPLVYSAVFDSIADTVIVVNPDKRVMAANNAAGKLFTLTKNQLSGKSIFDLFSGAPSLYQIDWKQHSQFEITWRDQSYEASITSVYSGSQIIGYTCIFRDITTRKRIDRELRLRERALDASTVGVLINDARRPDYPVIYANNSFVRMTGYDKQEVIGRDSLSFYGRDESLPSLQLLQESMMAGQSYRVQVQTYRKDGSRFWSELNVAPIFDEKGDVSHFISIQNDLTLQMEMERELQDSEARYRSIIATMADGVMVQTSETVSIEVNAAAERILGLSIEQLTGKKAIEGKWDSIREDYTPFPLAERPASVTLKTGQPQRNVVIGIRKPSGELIWIMCSSEPLLRNNEKLPYAAVITFTDITEQKRYTETVNHFVNDMKRLQEVAIEITETSGLDQTYRRVVELAKQKLGFDRVALFVVDQTKNMLLGTYGTDPDGNVRSESSYREQIPESHWTHEITNSVNHAVLWNDAPIYEYGQAIGVGLKAATALWNGKTAIGYLVTDNFYSRQKPRPYKLEYLSLYGSLVGRLLELKQIEAKRISLLAEVESVNKELGDFAYIVSHDLKAPLRALHSLAAWLIQDYHDLLPEEGREMLRTMQGRVDRLNALINGILQYSRTARTPHTNIEIDLKAVLRNIIDLLAPPSSIQIEIDPEIPNIVGPPTHLQQVFQNLIGNAIKFNDKPQGKISIGCTIENSFYRFSVTDNGPGIEARYFEKIFQIFQTLKTRDEQENTGVGLAIVKKIVESYGGQVWLESTPGKGSTFYFTFPASLRIKP